MALSDKIKGRLFTGARAKFSIEGTDVGYARNVAVTEEIVYEPVNVLGNIRVEEFVPVAYNVRFTASMFRIVGQTLKKQDWFAKVGQDSGKHLENILLGKDMVATIQDSKTGEILATLEQVQISSHNFSVDALGVVGEDMEFVAVLMRDETGD